MAIGKRLKKAREGVDREKLYALADAIKMVKERATSKFDETVEISINLGVDPRHADQMVRGVVTLPNGTGRTLRVGVFARGAKAEEAKAAGADVVGAEDLVEKVQGGQIDFDRCIATPDMMPLVGRLGKVLGPRGMMPNPKIGTVTMDIANAVKGAKGGSVEFRVEKAGIVQAGIGKASFTEEKLVAERQGAGRRGVQGEAFGRRRAPTSSALRFPPPWDRASRLSRAACSAEAARRQRTCKGGTGKPVPPFSLSEGNQSMPNKVLVYSRFPKAMLTRFGERFELMDAAGKPPNEVFSAAQLADVTAMITAGGTPLGAAAMDMLPKLAAIVCYGTGYDGVDLAAAAQRGVAVGHSPGANAASVADIAVILMLAVTRRLLPADDYVRSGSWSGGKPSPLMRPQPGNPGRRVGVYGMGEIGRKIASRVAAFECEVGYFSRSKHDVPYQYLPSLGALAEWCSVLMVAVRAGADTHHAVNADILRKLGKGGYVVNIARGSVIDQQALVTALTDETIAGAGLDVFEKEPHAPDALTALPNVVLTPHIGGHTLDSHTAMQDCVIANLDAFFAGKPLDYGVRNA